MFRNKKNYWNMFFGRGWYYTMNATLTIQFLPFIQIIGGIVLCSSTMAIMLKFIIRCMLMMWSMLSFTIIIGGTEWLPGTPTLFWITFTITAWLMLYKYSLKIRNKNILRKKLNAWYIFHFTYYWLACEKSLCQSVKDFI